MVHVTPVQLATWSSDDLPHLLRTKKIPVNTRGITYQIKSNLYSVQEDAK